MMYTIILPNKTAFKTEFELIEKRLPHIEGELKGMKSQINSHSKEFPNIYQSLSKTREKTESKAGISDVLLVQENFRNYATIKQVEDFMKQISDKTTEMNSVSDVSLEEVEKLKLIVGRFDEILNDK